jgi:hypothetical protein
MYKKLICISTVFLLLIFGTGILKADITIEMKSSFSGIPFLQTFEMSQTFGIQGDRMISATDGELNVADTTVSFKSTFFMDLDKQVIRNCNWEDSSCQIVDLASIEQLLNSGLEKTLMDTIKPYLEMASQYVQITNASVSQTGNTKKISGYKCDEVIFDFSGSANPPLPQLQGDIKFSITGTSWVTDDFPHADEYSRVMEKAKSTFLTPKVETFINEVLGHFGIGPSLMDTYLELLGKLYVEMAMNMKLEVWAEGMEVPSMSFNIRYNSVLVDISFDKISNSVFEAPANFSTKTIDVLNLFK